MARAHNAGKSVSANRDEVLIANIETILKELSANGNDSDQGVSCREIREVTGWNREKVLEFLRSATQLGLCEVGARRREQGIDGIVRPIPTYVFKIK